MPDGYFWNKGVKVKGVGEAKALGSDIEIWMKLCNLSYAKEFKEKFEGLGCTVTGSKSSENRYVRVPRNKCKDVLAYLKEEGVEEINGNIPIDSLNSSNVLGQLPRMY